MPKNAGEAVDPSNFLVPPMTLTAAVSMPLQSPLQGWVDPAFADLYHMARLAFAGTPTTLVTKSRQTAGPSATSLLVDNAADFVRLATPFTVQILDAGVQTAANVTSVNKRTGQFLFSAALGRSLTTNALLYVGVRAADDIYHERGFSLVSLREGLMSGCLVKSLGLTFKPGESTQVEAEIQACRLDRHHQVAIRSSAADIISAYGALPPARMVGHTAVTIESLSSPGWAFGMSGAVDDPAFRGFQGIDLAPTSIEQFTFRIDNAVKPVHSLHALGAEPLNSEYSGSASRERMNAFPYALVSESRVVSGELSYKAPIEPWALAERLSGPSGVGQNGLRVSADTFRIDMPNVVWSPAESDGASDQAQTRRIKWTMVSDVYESLPELQYIST
ncbi:MAG: hypothetical protein JSS66_05005 [Armatimonadetes bacterium]|nr:hypothetical protein [Armatimonadota bacterium]